MFTTRGRAAPQRESSQACCPAGGGPRGRACIQALARVPAVALHLLPLTVVLWLVASVDVYGARFEMDLSGIWQFQKSTQTNYPPPSNWQTTTVPGYLSGNPYEHAWYRKTFVLPSSTSGSRIKLHFGGVKFNSQVWLNGVFVGSYLNGYEPFELDATPAAQPGQNNELILLVTDWTATFGRLVDFSNLAPYENPRDHATNALLAPIGGRYDLYGVWQAVSLVSVSDAAIEDVLVMPSVRQKRLTARITLRNEAVQNHSVILRARVLDGGSTVLSFPETNLTLAAASTNQFDLAVAWTDPHFWTHQDPYLYLLETTVADPASPAVTEDGVTTRFGFREFWCETNTFLLNGIPIHLLATATWPPTYFLTRDEIRQVLLDVKAGNNVAIRFHTQPWDEAWYDVADEVGLLVVEEGAVWCDAYSYQLANPLFWEHYAQHLRGALRRDHNHPSIVLWSLENELLSVGGARAYAGTEQQLANLGRLVRSLDPTRAVTYESDLDPGGVADVIGLHYPHEFPDYSLWPNAAYWMDQPIPRDWVPGGQWTWLRDKPLYIGEFLWVPPTSGDPFTILYGDDAYFDPASYRNLAKAWTWRMQIEAYRSYGVNGMCPWTMFEDPAAGGSRYGLNPTQNTLYQSQKTAYAPNAIFVQPYHTRFFAGDSAPRTLTIYNDSYRAGQFNWRWRAGASGAWTSQSVNLGPAEKRVETILLPVPTQPGSFSFDLAMDDGTAAVFSNSLAYAAYPRPQLSLPPGMRLGVYDPVGTTTNVLLGAGVPFLTVTNLQSAPYDSLTALIVGRNALTNEIGWTVGPDTVAGNWEDFARRRGGRIIILEQTVYPRWMPWGLGLEDVAATMAFPDSRHSLTKGLTAEDCRWWADDHRLASHAIRLPTRGNFQAPVRIGSLGGMEYAGWLEVGWGKGSLLCSQLLLVERFNTEPMAGLLWQRLLDYAGAATSNKPPGAGGLLAETNSATTTRLLEMGALAASLSGTPTNLDPQLYPVLIAAYDGATGWDTLAANLSNVVSYVRQGGCVWLHRPSDAFLSVAQPLLFPRLEWASVNLGQVWRRDHDGAAPVLSNHDLHWVSQAGTWNQPEVVSTNLATRVYRKRFNLTSPITLQAATMPIHTVGIPVSGGWELYANGYVAQDVTISNMGSYLFSVTARGQPLGGIYPLMSLRVDGHIEDSVYVNSQSWQPYSMSADLAAGTHELAVSFDNDAYAPPEDRNLFVGQIQYGLDTNTTGVTFLTKPGVVVQVEIGNGRVVLDEVTWDREVQSRFKAERIASTLLTGLGVGFQTHPSLRLNGSEMTNVGVASYGTNNVSVGRAGTSSLSDLENPFLGLLSLYSPGLLVWPGSAQSFCPRRSRFQVFQESHCGQSPPFLTRRGLPARFYPCAACLLSTKSRLRL